MSVKFYDFKLFIFLNGKVSFFVVKMNFPLSIKNMLVISSVIVEAYLHVYMHTYFFICPEFQEKNSNSFDENQRLRVHEFTS